MLDIFFFFFKQKTAYEMRISDWSSDVCSSDLASADAVAITDRAGRLVCANDRYEALFGGLPTPPGLPVGDSDVSLLAAAGRAAWRDGSEIGRASCGERVC